MKNTLTEKFLLFLADWFDFNSRWSWKTFMAMPDDPRLRHHRRWMKKYIENRRKKQKLYRAFRALERREFFQEKILGNTRGYILSPKGQLKILRLKIKQLDKRKLQNNFWLMVLFDIPERLKKMRDIFRKILHELGFEQLQKSVWITPYNVLKELKELIRNCHLEKFVKYLFVKEIRKPKSSHSSRSR